MTLNELDSFFQTLLQNITSGDGSVSRTSLLSYVVPAFNLARLTDSDDISFAYFRREPENAEIDGFLINETGERLQLFLSGLVLPGSPDVRVARKDYYDSLFARARNFFTRAVKNYFTDVQAADPAAPLIRMISDPVFQDKTDVVEIFLVTNTISVDRRGSMSAKNFLFTDDEISVSYTAGGVRKTKKITVKYQLADLNRIYSYEITEGNPEPIIIDFAPPLKAVMAADDAGLFTSYLAVIPAPLLVSLYHDFSSRLLERNVRSFLQFKGVNQKLKETLAKEPDKFIAYNNGLTITATAAEIEEKEGISVIRQLTDFQIVNGGQTTASVYFSAKEGIDVSKVHVTAKINVVKSADPDILDELISKISQYSNSQNKVSAVDLNSRSAHLLKIKKLSESITDPSNAKWFFERIRGDFNTLLRINPRQKAQTEKMYPKNKRLNKEQLAKYFVAWGAHPYLVRKGGEKVFRDFMELIQKDHAGRPVQPEQLGRAFYEDLIAKAIMFKELEQLYGSGQNSIGQIRSSVVPYTLSLLHELSNTKRHNLFDLGAVWSAQRLPDDLQAFCKEMLQLVHGWCKQYSKSDDVGEYAKKEELWKSIAGSNEFLAFRQKTETQDIIRRYCLSEADHKRRYENTQVIDFSLLTENGRIFANGIDFYTALRMHFFGLLSNSDMLRLDDLSTSLSARRNLNEELVLFEDQLLRRLQQADPDWFLENSVRPGNIPETVNRIISICNKNVNRVKEAFEAERVKALSKGCPENLADAFTNIGSRLAQKEDPAMRDVCKLAELPGK